MNIKAGSRHSASDMEIIRACRKATDEYTKAMRSYFIDLGDDTVDEPDSIGAETDAVRSTKAAPTTTAELLQELLDATVGMWFTASVAHWNVTGDDFVQFHAFYGDVYEMAQDSIDSTAEQIRACGALVMPSLNASMQLPDYSVNDNAATVATLTLINASICALLGIAIYTAGIEGKPAVQNYLQDRLAAHEKLRWQLNAIQTPSTEPGEIDDTAEAGAAEVETEMKTTVFHKIAELLK